MDRPKGPNICFLQLSKMNKKKKKNFITPFEMVSVILNRTILYPFPNIHAYNIADPSMQIHYHAF